jgi:lysophospholipase L1-like esterase
VSEILTIDDTAVIIELGSGTVEVATSVAGSHAHSGTYAPLAGSTLYASRLETMLAREGAATELSPVVPTVTPSAPGAATSISGGVLRRPKGAGPSAAVDMDGDQSFFYFGTPSLAYGTAFPDYFAVRAPLLTGGAAQSAHWWSTARFWYDGQVFEVALKAVTTSWVYRLKINGRYVTEAQQSATGLTAGNLHLIKFDLGSGGVNRLIEIEFAEQFGGVWVEPTATCRRGPRTEFTGLGLGDSITGGANAVARPETWLMRAAAAVGCDGWANAAIGGTGYTTLTGTSAFRDRIGDVTAIAPDVLWIFGGQNDQAASAAALQAEATHVVQTIQAALPKTFIFLVGMWVTGNPDASRVTLNNALKAAAVATGVDFINLLDPTGHGATAPAWAASTLYRPGDMVQNGGIPYVARVEHTSGGSFSATNWQGTGIIFGTGKVGATTGNGNADVAIQADGVHPTAIGQDILKAFISAESRRLMRARLTTWTSTSAA